jgi:hypothetical protein
MGFYPNKLTRKLSTWFGRTDTLLQASFRPRLAMVPLTATAGAVQHSVNIAVTVN